MDDIGCDLWTVPKGLEVTFEDLSAHIHPADRDRVRAAFVATQALVGPFEIDFRILVQDTVRWISARGRGDNEGIKSRVMYGVFLDVTGRKQAEEAHEVLAGDEPSRQKPDHHCRPPDLHDVALGGNQGGDGPRTDPQIGGARTSARPGATRTRADPGGTLLGDLLTVLLTPYDDLGAFSGRIRVSVPRMGIGEGAATNLALVMHELATNSVKHGALSSPAGLLDVACLVDQGEAVITWTESGGPVVEAPVASSGFGGQLLDRIVVRQLRGSVDYDWRAEGLVAAIRVKTARLAS